MLASAACARLSAANLGPSVAAGRRLTGRLQPGDAMTFFLAVTDDLAPYVPRARHRGFLRGRSGLESEHRSVTVAFLHVQGLDGGSRAGDPRRSPPTSIELVRLCRSRGRPRRLLPLDDIDRDGAKVVLSPVRRGHWS